MDRTVASPLGSTVTLAQLEGAPYDILAELRVHEPVSWVPALEAWLVTRRSTAAAVLRNAQTFTVEDPRFTTARVVGPSMLSLDGAEHDRHRRPFAEKLNPAVPRIAGLAFVDAEARRLVSSVRATGTAELRTELAAPLAAAVIHRTLGLHGTDVDTLLGWYTAIVGSVSALSAGNGEDALTPGRAAMAGLQEAVLDTVMHHPDSLMARLAAEPLDRDELVSNTAVLLFGAIETAEGMTANALHHLLTEPGIAAELRAAPGLIGNLVDESLRMEPAAARVDRYATRDVTVDGVEVSRGDPVVVSLTAAGRDPATFARPDTFDLHRHNARQHLAFAQGPHTCIGIHLARAETTAMVHAVLDLLPDLRLDDDLSTRPTGLVFRKPAALIARWAR